METTENKYSRYHCGHKRPKAGWIVLGIFGFAALVLLFGGVTMWLWNWLMPAIFKLGVITYWQAVGLAILGRLLLGGFHHGGHHNKANWRQRFHHRHGHHGGQFSPATKWSYYEQYWNEEGERSFNDYVTRKSESMPKE